MTWLAIGIICLTLVSILDNITIKALKKRIKALEDNESL